MPNPLRLPLLVLGTVTLLGCATTAPTPPAETTILNLLGQHLDDRFASGKEVVVSYLEFPPHAALPRHWHPGEEFIYFLDGDAEIRIDGSEPIIGRPGRVAHVPYQRLHSAVAGVNGVKLVVFRVHTRGEPARYLEGGASAPR